MLALAAAGCASGTKAPASAEPSFTVNGNVRYGTFARDSLANLDPSSPLSQLHVAGERILGYTKNNSVYSLTPGLEIRYIQKLAADDVTLRKPVAYGEEIIYPSTSSMKVLNDSGETVRTIPLPNPLTSNVRLDQRGLLLAGTVAPTGGRVSVIDPKLTVRPVVGDTLIGSVFAAPAGFQGVVYAATDEGNVFAVAADNRTAWPLTNLSFSTNRSVKADLVIDDYALYVASSDTVLYALDRTSGHIKWRYMGEVPLTKSPLVTADRVYQVVDGRGLAAIDKIEGKLYREPLWLAPDVTQVLSVEGDYVYAVQGNNRLVALGASDGQVKFDMTGEFTIFTAGPGGRIYAGNERGVVASFVRRPYTGESVATK